MRQSAVEGTGCASITPFPIDPSGCNEFAFGESTLGKTGLGKESMADSTEDGFLALLILNLLQIGGGASFFRLSCSLSYDAIGNLYAFSKIR